MHKFQVRQFDQRTLSWWNNRRNQIDMDPPYQRRGRLWSTADKAYLIDSIINGFDVPKIYIADFTWGESALNERKLPYAIIDGKQRLEAIFDFFSGEIVLNSDFVYRSNKKLKLGGLGYRDLEREHPEVAEEFDNFNLHIMSVYSDTEDLINDLFVRLNRSKPLTGAEIRNAMGGPVPEILRNIAAHGFFIDNIRFSTKRGADLNAAAKLLLFEYSSKTRETKKAILDRFVQDAARFDSEQRIALELAARRVLDVLRDMASVFLPRDQLLTSAGLVPVYYWLVRELDETSQSKLRGFLISFDERRKNNRKLVVGDPENPGIDRELLEYDNYNRSTNDQSSHEGRYRILRRRFEQYLVP